MLTIRGTGAMRSYNSSYSFAPWYSSRSSITSVVIEDGVTSIGSYAFYDCDALTSVSIGSGVTSIGSYAFYDCDTLANIYYNSTYADFLNISGNNAISGKALHCTDLETIEWGFCGDDITYVLDNSGTLTISGTGWMTSYNSYSSAPWYSSRSSITSVVIEDGVATIGSYAFIYCNNLSSIIIPASVTSIGTNAFSGCYALTDIYYSGSYIDFMNVSGSDTLLGFTVHFTDTEAIGWGTCGDNVTWTLDNLGTLTISGTDEMTDYSVEGSPFYAENDITSVVIESGVTSIGSYAFSGCDALTSVTIPAGVASIGNSAFESCTALTDIYYGGSYTDFMNVSGSDALLGLTVHFTDTEAVRWGTCGENVTWALDSSGVLTISGTGRMTDYSSEETPSYAENNITSVIINNGITHIGSNAFYNLSALMSVTIPESVVSIGSSAFSGCTGLSNLSLSDGLSEIGDSAFAGCTALTDVAVPGSVRTIGNSSFSGCTELSSLSLSDGLSEIGDSAFAGCTALTNVAVPGSVVRIGNCAFSGCTGLAGLSLSDGLSEIGDSAFAGCSSLTDIDIPETVVTIGAGAFNNCSGFISIIIPEGVASIGAGAFENCSALTSITISENVKEIGEDAFYNCSNLTSMYITDLAAYLDAEYGNSRSNPMYYADRLYINNIRVTNIDIPYGVTAIPAYAFSGCDGLRKVTIPDSVQSIGEYAFSGCLSLGSIEIPGSVTSIGNNAFFNCSGMINLKFGSGIESIGIMAFDGCSSLKKIEIPDSVTSIRQGAFNNCSGLLEMTLPFVGGSPTPSNEDEGMFAYIFYLHGNTAWIPPNLRRVELTNTETIPQKAFYDCDRLTEIILPDTVKTIESMAFDSCTGLRSIDLPDALTSIGYSAFFGCSSLTEITMGDNVTSIGNNAFGACSGLRNVTIGSNVTTIGDGAFTGCSGLTSITIPENVESIGSIAFGNCSSLTSLNYNASDCTVSENWLGGSNGITYFDYPPLMYLRTGESVNRISAGFVEDRRTLLSVILSSNTTTIDTDAFSGCTELRRLYIPRSVTEIEMGAFENCTSLIAVEYGGSENDWQNIYIGANNECLINAPINYNSLADNAEITDADLLTYITNADNTITITNCYENAVTIDIPAEINGMPVTAINSSAFANRTYLQSVTIPASVTSIGTDAFNGCTALSEIAIPDGVASIANSAFYGCTSLERVTIPASGTSIDNYAFYGCSSLTEVYYAGTEEQWAAVSKGYSNDPLINAAIYYNGTKPEPEPTPLPMTTAEITKTDTETGYAFEVTPETAYENCSVYAAVYDENGILIALSRVPLNMEGSTSVEVGKSENDSKASVFIWADTSQPIIIKEDFAL